MFFLTLSSGTTFLMESEGIDDVIVNSTALGFLLSIDELILSAIQSPSLDFFLHNCAEYPLYDVSTDEHNGGDEIRRSPSKEELRSSAEKAFIESEDVSFLSS